MGRVVGWTLGAVVALAVSAAPAAAQSWSVGVHIGNGPVYAPVPYPYYAPAYYPPPVYYPPVYHGHVYRPVYRQRVYYPAPYYYRSGYRDRVVVVNGGRDNGRYRNDQRGRGPGWRDDQRGRRR